MSSQLGRRVLEVERHGEVTVVHFPARYLLDSETIGLLGKQFSALAEEVGRGQVVLNFAHVEGFPSRVLAALIALHNKLEAAGGRLVLCNVKPPLEEVLKKTRLDTFFHSADETTGRQTGRPALSPPSPETAGNGRASRCGAFGDVPVALCDPQPARAGQLVQALAGDFDVVHF